MEWQVLPTSVPVGFAHQGGSDVAPGNTIAAFDHAVALGYRYLETDVQATADGVLAVFHDDDLTALTGVDGRVEDRSWDELSELRVGGEHPIPRFDAVVARYPDVRFNIEPKNDGAVEPLVELIRDRGLVDRVLVASFDDGRVRRIRAELGPRLATAPGRRGAPLVALRSLLWPRGRSRFAALQIPSHVRGVPLTRRWLLRAIQARGIQVHVWTVNDEQEMLDALDAGVDAIMTDRVALLHRVLEERHRR